LEEADIQELLCSHSSELTGEDPVQLTMLSEPEDADSDMVV
jgi:hypothetical protein